MKPKIRNLHAVDAWTRHGGSHSPGSKKPAVNDLDRRIDEALDEAEDELLDLIFEGGGVLEIDGERLLIEFDWEGDGDEEE